MKQERASKTATKRLMQRSNDTNFSVKAVLTDDRLQSGMQPPVAREHAGFR